MPRNALKASWEVKCGLIPGEFNSDWSRRWEYLSKDYDEDYNIAHKYEYHAIYSKIRAEAMDYYLQMSDPRISNWATIEFIWY